ncbi:lysis protein [Pseudomonas luteola]|uniref:lysis system i-spanin subunit Rz n=1 Tax=Pseudomonas TaxID=286 RepID=UPI00390C9A75
MQSLILKWGIAAAIVLALLYAPYRYGVHETNEKRDSQDNAALAKANEKVAEAERKARETERKSAETIAAIEARLSQENQSAQAEDQRTIDQLRTDNLRLRKRFSCSSTGAASVSTPSTGTGSSDAGAASGLQRADAEFLIRLAGRADAVARQLKACQSILQSDRKGQ